MKTAVNPKKQTDVQPAPDPKSYEIILGPAVKVTTDKKSKTRVVSFPFEFADKTAGVLIICRVKDEEWTPANDITKITIEFA